MQSKLLQKQGTTAPVVNEPPIDERTRRLLFRTEAESEADIAEASEAAKRGETTPYEQVKADQDKALAGWIEEAKRNRSR